MRRNTTDKWLQGRASTQWLMTCHTEIIQYTIWQLWDVTCHMGSHSVTCHPTQVNVPRLNPSHAGWYSIYLQQRDGRLSWPSWLDSTPAGSRISDLSITSPTANCCTTKTTVITITVMCPRRLRTYCHVKVNPLSSWSSSSSSSPLH